MSSEFTSENVQNLFSYPSAFGESRKSEVVRIHFAQAWKKDTNHQSTFYRLVMTGRKPKNIDLWLPEIESEINYWVIEKETADWIMIWYHSCFLFCTTIFEKRWKKRMKNTIPSHPILYAILLFWCKRKSPIFRLFPLWYRLYDPEAPTSE